MPLGAAVLSVELSEPDLRRLDDLWPVVQEAPDRQTAAQRFVDRVAAWLAARQRCEQLVADVYAFARRLGQVTAEGDLHRLIVSTLAERTGAQQAALALYDEHLQRLAIVATHGYPAVLVEDLRIAPGEGVIGEVFATREPLLVADAARERVPHTRRLRYRTGSFMALPVYTDVALGVLTLADRTDLQPFTRPDLTQARAMLAPAALALVSSRLAGRAKELAHAAAVDPLTGLFNRRYFETRIEEEIQRARRYSLDLALLVIDADNFKSLNDVLGHLVGDRVLRAMSDTLRRSVRAFDVCTRFGGEEFAILMPGSNASSAMQSAERIRQRIAEYKFDPLPMPPHMHPTISIGVSVLTADNTAQDLIARADRALYVAKAEGKNCVRVASE